MESPAAASLLSPAAEKVATRPRQFEIMLSFMEEHGDLATLARLGRSELSYAQRRAAMDSWERLGALLNAQAAPGHARSLDKWKKVWSDFKNNTKKKARRLTQAARAAAGAGAGGGSPTRTATRARLTKLELRVLKVMGMVKQSTLTVPPLRSLASQPEPPPELPLATLPEPPPLAPLHALHSWDGQVPHDPLITPKQEPQEPESQELEIEVHRDLLGSSSRSASPQPEETEDPMEEKRDLSRPASRGHTSTRGVRGARCGGRGARCGSRCAGCGARCEGRGGRGARRDRSLQRGWQRICERGLALLERFLDNQNPARPSTSRETPERQDTEEAPDNSAAPDEPSLDVGEAREEKEPHRPLVFHPERLL